MKNKKIIFLSLTVLVILLGILCVKYQPNIPTYLEIFFRLFIILIFFIFISSLVKKFQDKKEQKISQNTNKIQHQDLPEAARENYQKNEKKKQAKNRQKKRENINRPSQKNEEENRPESSIKNTKENEKKEQKENPKKNDLPRVPKEQNPRPNFSGSGAASLSLDHSSVRPVISNLSFDDVAGVDDVKTELGELVDFLQNPKKYKEFGVKMPKGVLMVGPPGVGKTLIAKAVAGEAGVPFFYQSGASFVEIYVGMGAKRVRELFARAKMMAPSIIFIDEIDAVGQARGEFSNVERDSTLNQLLTQMDGFEENSGVIVIAATNKIELMDAALLRSGRFDRRIFLSLPDLKDRLKILEIYMRDKFHFADLEKIAKTTAGFSGAALETLVNEAAINAIRRDGFYIEESDFEEVLGKVILGQKRAVSLSEEEKKIQAHYQAAKAISAYYFDIAFESIGLVEDRFKTLERSIRSKSELINRIKIHLAGSRAMKLIYNESFSNSQNDLEKIKELVDFLSDFDIDDDLSLNKCKQEMDEFLSTLREQIDALAKRLLEREKISYEDVRELVKN